MANNIYEKRNRKPAPSEVPSLLVLRYDLNWPLTFPLYRNPKEQCRDHKNVFWVGRQFTCRQ